MRVVYPTYPPKLFINSIVNFENRGYSLSSVSLATERVPPQEISLHTILPLVFKLFIFRCLYCNCAKYSYCCYLSVKLYVGGILN